MTTSNSSFARRISRGSVAACIAILSMACFSSSTQAQWPQWGGPNRDFKSASTGLADKWPADGPKQLWSRKLGDGYSAISADGGRLYTMYRADGKEFVIALRTDNGKTVWEHGYETSLVKGADKRFGDGPNSTPLVHDGRVYTLGVGGQLVCLSAANGKPVWSHDLVEEYGAKSPGFGFSSSPTVYKDSLITAVGGEGCGMMAFDLKSGSLLWKKNDFENTFSSPLLINVDGMDQVVLLTDREIVGVDPKNGELLWKREHVNQWKTNISTPVWGDDNLLFVTSGGEARSRGLKLTQAGGKTKVEEVWTSKKLQVGQGNVIRIGDYLYGSSGGQGGSSIGAMDAKTGDVAWRERGFAKAMLLHADGKLIILDEKGNLGLATATPKAFTVLSRTELFKGRSWSIPVLVGKKLFVRDRETIVALDLG